MATKKPRSNTQVSSKSISTNKSNDQVKPTKLIPEKHDNPRSLAVAGLIGLILAYLIGSRALNTGSYWEYLATVILLVISIRIFIRSIRLK